MTLRHTLDFLLYDWLRAQELAARPRFADHSRETFDAVFDTCERIAREKYAPFNRTVDTEEPRFDGEKVILPQATHEAYKAFAGSGMLSAAQDYEIGGMQLPYTVEAAAHTFFAMASASMGSGMLTVGNANLLMVHGTELQKKVFALNEFSGRWSGTMCLSEPQAGSSLSDVATRAVPDGDGFESEPLGPRYRLTGNKMWISAGEHELTENIIHLVLAKIPGPDGKTIPGTRGISLFIVPKKLVDTNGRLTSAVGFRGCGAFDYAVTYSAYSAIIAIQYYRYTNDTAFITGLRSKLEAATAYHATRVDANGLVVTDDNDYWQTRQTGEVTGKAPLSWFKILLLTAVIAAAIVGIILLVRR